MFSRLIKDTVGMRNTLRQAMGFSNVDVVFLSCGSLIHNNSLILPYAVSDYSSTYAVVDLVDLMDALKKSKR